MNHTNYTVEALGKDLFKNLWNNKTESEIYLQLSKVFGDNESHAERLYSYFINKWFLPGSPIIGCVPFQNELCKGLPISCFLSETGENGLYDIVQETAYLSKHSGGLGVTWTNTPSIYVNNNGGTIAQINIQGKIMKYCGGHARKIGSMCAWLNIDHADIEQFINMRINKSGVDIDLQAPRYIHHGVIFTDEFMLAVKQNKNIALKDYSINKVIKEVNARELFDKIISIRSQTGEPLIFFEGNANKVIAEHHKKLGLKIKTTNLCTEIVLPTGIDHKGIRRTAVCCLSSINLEKRDEWINNKDFILDIAKFMDNVLTYFNIISTKYHVGDIVKENVYYFATYNRHKEKEAVDYAFATNHPLKSAIYSAFTSRDIGVGVVGLQSLFQKNNIAVEHNGKLTIQAKELNIEIFKDIYNKFNIANNILAKERGSCSDVIDAKVNYQKRFSYMLAIAPTTVISTLMNTSQGIEFVAPNYIYKNQTVNASIYNKYLLKILQDRNLNNVDIWRRISNGDYHGILSEYEYEVFKGGSSINQLNILEMAADRTPYIDQAQSINLAISRNILSAKPLREMILYAYNNNIKTLYYAFNETIDNISANLSNDNNTSKNIDNSINISTEKNIKDSSSYSDNSMNSCLIENINCESCSS